MKVQQIVQEVFQNMGKMYESIFQSYYPSHKSNGFTERNLTFYFSHYYLKNANNLSDIIIWQEVPIDGGEHFDTLIIDSANKKIFIIEAKRLQNDKKRKSIENDLIRILQRFNEISDITKFIGYQKFALLLADIWIPEKRKKKKNDLKDNFINLCSISVDFVQNNIVKIESMANKSKEEYLIMYNLYEIDEILKNYSIQDDSIIRKTLL